MITQCDHDFYACQLEKIPARGVPRENYAD